jgi:hypothetical protein
MQLLLLPTIVAAAAYPSDTSALHLPCQTNSFFCPTRHAAELRAAGADKLCIVNSEAGLNLGAQLLADLGSSETSVSLLRRGINEALAVRTAADNARREGKEAGAATQASGDAAAAAAAAQNSASSNGSSDKKKKKQKQVELFVLDGKHAYGLRAEALARAVSPDLPCTECPLVKQQQEADMLASLDESLVSSGMLSSSSSVASVADVDAAAAAAAVPVAELNGSSSKSAAAAAVSASVGGNATGGPGAGST